jgi:mannosylglycoprotein endo-beta-mannosidase
VLAYLKDDVTEVFACFSHGEGRGSGAVNLALITLLPKKPDTLEVKDFRPISLIHNIPKLVAKVMACSLAPHVSDLVGSAFICRHDNFQLVKGTTRRLNGFGVGVVMFKLDITKDFNAVDWAFLLELLANMGFGECWLLMICAILSSATMKVLLNGASGDININMHGLQRGDPLSRMLFVKIMAVIKFMIQKVAAEGLLSDLVARGMHHRTSIFVDDVVNFQCSTCLDVATCAILVYDFSEALTC